MLISGTRVGHVSIGQKYTHTQQYEENVGKWKLVVPHDKEMHEEVVCLGFQMG